MASQIKESSSNANNLRMLSSACEVIDILKMISPRWKMPILVSIYKGQQQFSRLKAVFPSLSDQVLGKRLGELVNDGLIEKQVIPETCPYQIVYTHTAKAEELIGIIKQLQLWGKKTWEQKNNKPQQMRL
jgi:DNA-binding HxlR family transcriptional regulator